MGGAMEALVKITKGCLKDVVKDWLLHEGALHMLLFESESIVNSRPLTSASDNVDDLEPLTQNHFLIGQLSTTQTSQTLQKRMLIVVQNGNQCKLSPVYTENIG